MRLLSLLLASLLLASCSGRQLERRVYPASGNLLPDTTIPYLKVHYMNGSVSVLEKWSVDERTRMVSGTGTLYGINRDSIQSGALSVMIDSVALFETNRVIQSTAIYGMSIMTGISAAVTVACLANPKACFGSCPTFYATDGGELTLQAEGFSSSIAPALEATDIDHLYRTDSKAGSFTIRMTNEALETHVIRHADLLAIPRPAGGRIHVSPAGTFHAVANPRPPVSATGPEGDCLRLLTDLDSLERTSPADSTDLAARETLDIHFDPVPDGELAIVLGFRESLMTTYLFYQGLAYLGRGAPAWIANCQRDPEGTKRRLEALDNVLGGIDLLVENEAGEWVEFARAGESGPIATNLQLLALPRGRKTGSLHIRVRMAKGLWRLNSIALASVTAELSPLRLHPVEVLRGTERDDGALADLLDPARTLLSMPGDTFNIRYELPDNGKESWELFLESRGYYIEWMRNEWLADENPGRGALMFINPAGYLKMEAAGFKKLEPMMEDTFWRSRYVRTH